MMQTSTNAEVADLTPEQSIADRQQNWATFLTKGDGALAAARPRLIRLAQLRGVAFDAVEDIVQETFFEAWKHLDRLQSPEGFSAWIDEICRNICRRYERKHYTEIQHYAPFYNSYQHDDADPYQGTSSLIADMPDPQSLDIVEALSREDLAVLLDRAMGELSLPARQAVEICYLLEVPQREAAARLGLTISALEARLHRARLQLRQILNGPLRTDAEALGLLLTQAQDIPLGWSETRLWCTICGQRRLHGSFEQHAASRIDLHLRCPDCWQHYLLSDTHSLGLVQLNGLQSFRPAWKRTMQEEARLLGRTLTHQDHPCPRCGKPASIRVTKQDEGIRLPREAQASPIQFWVQWSCPHCRNGICTPQELLSADELVYWSHPLTRQFILAHPRRINGPEQPVEYAGQPAISFQLADMSSSARLTVIAHRTTLQVLAVL